MNKLYANDTYLMQADTIITRVDITTDGNTVLCFRDLLFYPGGAGQPKETSGKVILRGQAFSVEDLIKFNGDVLIKLNQKVPFHGELRKGEIACQSINMARRILAARYHSLQHVYGAATRMVVSDYELGSMEIAEDLTRCRMRFRTAALITPAILEEIQSLVTSAIDDDLPIAVLSYQSVEDVRARYGVSFRLDSALPPFKGRNLRTVVIGELSNPFMDVSLCAGTHLRSLADVGVSEIVSCNTSGEQGEACLTFQLLS